ncbi:MAG: hypothetical protein HQL79_10870 [Magnetococcales bacterium]|nr:hypothetical protein [Magnetococcales bacterium]
MNRSSETEPSAGMPRDAPPEVRIRGEYCGDTRVITVRDNGIGIPKQFAERVFVVFQKLHPHGHYSGTGIGLTVCKRFVERHGGRTRVTPVEGSGATLCFSLPERISETAP